MRRLHRHPANLRKEVTRTSRYYFADVGLRNALIRSFGPLALRGDARELFENWFVIERVERAGSYNRHAGFYFWRTYNRHEIGLVEDLDGRLTGIQCKWSPASRLGVQVKAPKDWRYRMAPPLRVRPPSFSTLLHARTEGPS